jgi:hypothetical protein
LELDEQKGLELDCISPSILRTLVSVIKVPLTLLFNMSSSTGIFPTVWKESFDVPIFKSRISCDIPFVGDIESF